MTLELREVEVLSASNGDDWLSMKTALAMV
jgi:hypothetical protein